MSTQLTLSPRQQRALAEWTRNGGNQTQACAAAGYADPNAVASRVFRHPLMRGEMRRLLAEQTVTDARVMRKISELLDAETPEGDPENGTRLRAITLVCRLNGWLDGPRREEIARELGEGIAPLLMEFVPAERLTELRGRLRELYTGR